MTKKEIKKFNIIQSCIDGVYTVPEAASKLGLSDRQVQRLKKEVKLNGVNGVIHKSRGRKATNAIPDSLEDKIIELKQSYCYEKANFTHFTELLSEHENINLSYSCVYSKLKKKRH